MFLAAAGVLCCGFAGIFLARAGAGISLVGAGFVLHCESGSAFGSVEVTGGAQFGEMDAGARAIDFACGDSLWILGFFDSLNPPMRLAYAFDLCSDATTTNFLECSDYHRAGDWHGVRAFCAVPIFDPVHWGGEAGDLVAGTGDDVGGDFGEPGIFDEHREICGEICSAG